MALDMRGMSLHQRSLSSSDPKPPPPKDYCSLPVQLRTGADAQGVNRLFDLQAGQSGHQVQFSRGNNADSANDDLLPMFLVMGGLTC